MPLLNWHRGKYSVGVPSLDDQHAGFIASLNKLHAAMIRGQGKLVTGPLLQSLISGACKHIAAEEEFMTSTGYPGLPQHRMEHQTLLAKFEELRALHEEGDQSVCIPLLRFMRDWISKHIVEEDRKYKSPAQSHPVR